MQKAAISDGTLAIPFAASTGGAICAVFDETACSVVAPLPSAVELMVGPEPIDTAVAVFVLRPEGDDKSNDEADDARWVDYQWLLSNISCHTREFGNAHSQKPRYAAGPVRYLRPPSH